MSITTTTESEVLQDLWRDWSGPIWTTKGRNDGPWTLVNVNDILDAEFHVSQAAFDKFTDEIDEGSRCPYCASEGFASACEQCGLDL